jgi:uncharacterized protein YndB with AHSA1/START domain
MPISWEIVEESSAPVDAVWALLADARGWSRWARFARSELLHEGTPTPDGVGALRSFGTGPFRSQEEVVEFEPPNHLAYEIRKGMPITGYRADVRLEPRAAGGTTIRWSSSFDHARPRAANGFFRWFLRTFLRDTARRMARAAEASAP